MTEEEAEAWVRAALARPYARALYGIDLESVRPGAVVLSLIHRSVFEHAPGFFQGSITSALAELAASYSAATASKAQWQHRAVRQEIDFTGSARGERLIAVGQVTEIGNEVSFARAEVFAEFAGDRSLCALMMLTMRHRAPR